MFGRVPNLIARGLRVRPERRRLLGQATLSLTAASLAVALLPFRRAIWIAFVPLPGKAADPVDVQAMSDAVARAAQFLPWRPRCIQQGLALQRMLRLRGVDARLHYGIADKAGDGLAAHVWVSVAGTIVIGGEEAPNFTEVAAFPR